MVHRVNKTLNDVNIKTEKTTEEFLKDMQKIYGDIVVVSCLKR